MRATWRRHFLRCELWLCVLGTTAYAAWLYRWDGQSTVDTLVHDDRTVIYASLSAIAGALLGFIITAFSIIIGFSQDERFAVVFGSASAGALWTTFTSAIRAYALATAVTLVALLVDTDAHPRTWMTVGVVFVVMFATARLARVVWILEQMVALVGRR